ncbi:MAG TPA: hypothetical protein DEB31_01530 [Clostridiales bacterium]|nr:hypothetical protein [Clostridiales bacterium]
MKQWKKITAAAMAFALCGSLLAGCAGKKGDAAASETPGTQSQSQGAPYDGMKPGARVQTSVDPSGNKTYTFQNPDGSGGGGVELS